MCFLQFHKRLRWFFNWARPLGSQALTVNWRSQSMRTKRHLPWRKKHVEAIHALPGGGGHRRHYTVPYVGNTYCSIMKEEASDGQAFPSTCGDGPQAAGSKPWAANPGPRSAGRGRLGHGPRAPMEVALDEEGNPVASWGYAMFCEPAF
jgi:hypothetical protein